MSVGAVNKSTGDRIPTAGMPAIDAALSGSSTNPVQNMVVKAAFDAIKDGQSINSFADVETALGEKADTDIVASDFSTAVSYTAGNYCIYEGKFYKFKTSHSGAWSAADVDEIKIAGELSSLMSGLNNDTIQTVTAGSGVEVIDGGYTVIGKLVVVNVRINTDAITGGATILTGLPIPKSSTNVNLVTAFISNVENHINAIVTTSGAVQVNTALPSGINFVTATYVTN